MILMQKQSARYSRVLVVTQLVISGTECKLVAMRLITKLSVLKREMTVKYSESESESGSGYKPLNTVTCTTKQRYFSVMVHVCFAGIHCALDASQKPEVVFPTICGIFSAAKAMKAKDSVFFVSKS